MPPLKSTPVNIHKNLTVQEISPQAIFLQMTVWVSLHSNSYGSPKKCMYNGTKYAMVIQGNPRLQIQTSVESKCSFLLVINSHFGPIIQRFHDTAT